jgi:hypothetical protein
MTRTTTVTWGSLEDRNEQRLNNDGYAKLTDMMIDGKVEYRARASEISDILVVRYWKDQAAAEEFAAWLWATAEKYNVSVVSIEYGDPDPSLVAALNL